MIQSEHLSEIGIVLFDFGHLPSVSNDLVALFSTRNSENPEPSRFFSEFCGNTSRSAPYDK